MMDESIKLQGLELAKGAMLFGEKLEEMERDKLIAAAALGWKAYNDRLGYSPPT